MFVFLVMITFSTSAHELFIKPKQYRIAPFGTVDLRLFNGTFDKSENIIARDRMRDVSIIGGGPTQNLTLDQWRDEGRETALSYTFGPAGTYAVGVSTRPRVLPQTNTDFTDYLKHEGITDTLTTFEPVESGRKIRERYSKHVRTILQVGDTLSEAHKTILGYPVEIILLDNPASVNVGGEVRLKVLRNGAALSDQLVYASYSGYHAHNGDGGHERAVQMRTDAEGFATFRISKAGVWYVTLIHMEKLLDDPEADYESNWATLTFAIR